MRGRRCSNQGEGGAATRLQWWLRYGTTVTRQENLIQTSFVSRMNMFPGIAIHTVTLYTFFLDFFKYSNSSSIEGLLRSSI